MTDCKHGTDTDEFDCINCDNEISDFEELWKNDSEKDSKMIEAYRTAKLSEYYLAKKYWFAAIQYMVDEFHIGK